MAETYVLESGRWYHDMPYSYQISISCCIGRILNHICRLFFSSFIFITGSNVGVMNLTIWIRPNAQRTKYFISLLQWKRLVCRSRLCPLYILNGNLSLCSACFMCGKIKEKENLQNKIKQCSRPCTRKSVSQIIRYSLHL